MEDVSFLIQVSISKTSSFAKGVFLCVKLLKFASWEEKEDELFYIAAMSIIRKILYF